MKRWAVRVPFSVVSDGPKFATCRDEVRKVIEPLGNRDFEGVVWNFTYSFENIHTGNLYILLSDRIATFYKLSSTVDNLVELPEF